MAVFRKKNSAAFRTVRAKARARASCPVQRSLKTLSLTNRVICKPKVKATCRAKIAKACRDPSLVSLAPNPRANPVLSQAYPAPSPEMNRARLVSNLDNSLAYHLKPRSSPARYPVKFNRAPGRKDQHVCVQEIGRTRSVQKWGRKSRPKIVNLRPAFF